MIRELQALTAISKRLAARSQDEKERILILLCCWTFKKNWPQIERALRGSAGVTETNG